MRKLKRKYESPLRPWDKERIEKEKELLKNYGLKNKQEIWRTEGIVRKYRRLARELAVKKDKDREKNLIEKMIKLGLLESGAALDDVLALNIEKFLERRLQTIIFKKGLVNTIGQARQFVVHGHVKIGGRRIVYPSYLVSRDEENKLNVLIKTQKGEKSGGERKEATAA